MVQIHRQVFASPHKKLKREKHAETISEEDQASLDEARRLYDSVFAIGDADSTKAAMKILEEKEHKLTNCFEEGWLYHSTGLAELTARCSITTGYL